MKKICCLLVAMLFGGVAFAQNLGTGVYAFASMDNRGFDSINLGNLNTRFNIPIMAKPGRGLQFNYSIGYEGLIWQAQSSLGTTMWVPNPTWGFAGLLNGSTVMGYLTHDTVYYTCPGDVPADDTGSSRTSNYVYHDAAGRNHAFNYAVDYGCPSGQNPTYSGDGSAKDGSGYTVLNNITVEALNGTRVASLSSPTFTSLTIITDPKGNQIWGDYANNFTDTLGTTAFSITGSSPRTLTYPVTLQGDSATTASASVTYLTHMIRTHFQCSGIAEYGSTSADLPDRITLADGTYYSFTYEGTPGATDGAVTARLASITLPTGGTITYTYAGGCNGIEPDGSVAQLTRATTDGTRTYSRYGIDGTHSYDQMVDENNNHTNITFVSDPTSGVFLEVHRSSYQGPVTGTPLLERITCYNGTIANPNCDGQSFPLTVTEADVTQSNNGGTQATTKSTYSSVGLLTGSTQTSGGTALMSTFTHYNGLGEVSDTGSTDQAGNTFAYSYFGYDETTPVATSGLPKHIAPSGTPGNLTSSHVSAGNVYLTSTTSYYDTGMPISTTDPGGFNTSYAYDSTQTFTTQTTLPTPSSGIALSNSTAFDQTSGALTSATGMNAGQTVQVTQYDRLLRPITISLPNGGQITYNRTAYQNQLYTEQTMGNGQTAYWVVLSDSYGRTSRTALLSTNTWYVTDYCYDPSGLLQFKSLTYSTPAGFDGAKQCSGTGTAYIYDALGRMTSSSNADGTSTTQYQNRAVKTTDVNGVQRITQYDLLSRVAGICEISSSILAGQSPVPCGMDIAGIGYLTGYSYDLLNHKTTITQGSQTRTFQTDAAGRINSVTEPERGTTTYSYSYNSTGLLVTRTRPRANQSNASVLTTTTTQYDSLGRIVNTGYDDNLTPAKAFYYDRQDYNLTFPQNFSNEAGRLVGTIGGLGANRTVTQYAYDVMGNVTTMWQCAPSICGPDRQVNNSRPALGFGYDLANNLTYEGDGASGGISYGRSPAGEITSVTNLNYTDQYNTPNLVSNVVNTPFGPTSYQLGNGLYTVNSFDTSGRQNGTWVCGGSASFGCGNGSTLYGNYVVHSGSRLTYDEDTNMEPGKAPVYDEFNRLTGMNNAQNGQPFYTYVYDRWGNRTQQNALQGGPQPQFSFNGANQIIGMGYDAAGNLTSDGLHNYTYDAEGNVLSVDSGSTAQYVYDAMNNRVRVQTASSTYEYLFDPAGHRMSSWLLNGTISGFGNEGRIWSDGKLLATRDSNGTTYFHHSDWLGTERLRTNYQGQIATMSSSLAFGDGFSHTSTDTYGAAQDNNEFAGQDSDSESSTTHAQFRQYSPAQGRWMSPDPYDGSYDAGNPQSLNRYAYVLNNPLSYVDPSGENCSSNTTVTVTPNGTSYQQGDANCSSWIPSPGGTLIPWYIAEYGSFVCGSQNGSAWSCPTTTQNTPVSTSTQSSPPATSTTPSSPAVPPPVTTAPNKPNLPSCLAVGAQNVLNAAADTLGPITDAVGAISDLAAKGINIQSVRAALAAEVYAVTRINTKGGVGLLAPLKSSTYRALAGTAADLGRFASVGVPLATFDYYLISRSIDEYRNPTPCR